MRKQILFITALAEGFLLLVAASWIYLCQIDIGLQLNWTLAIVALVASLPLLVFNWLLFHFSDRSPTSPYRHFLEQFVYPLCKDQSALSALLISFMAGLAEEFFFRAALLSEAINWLGLWPALLIVNLLFAYVHFIGNVAKYWRLLLFYCLFGYYFSFLFLFFNSIWLPVISHALYNFTVILAIRAKKIPVAPDK